MKVSFKVHGLLWREISSLSGYIVPPLPRFDAEQASSLSAVLSSLNKGRNDTILSKSSDFEYKGSMGRITIVGGSAEYTGPNILQLLYYKCINYISTKNIGAPYYAAQSALKFGADLCSGKLIANHTNQLFWQFKFFYPNDRNSINSITLHMGSLLFLVTYISISIGVFMYYVCKYISFELFIC